MNEFEQWVADEVRTAVNEWSDSTERSQQSKEFRLGPSDLGFCSERVRRMLDQQEPEDHVDWNKAFIGTAIGDKLEEAMKRRWPHSIIQSELQVTLETETRTFQITGHADLIDPKEVLVLDNKAVPGLGVVRQKPTADQGYQFQRHLYGLGAWQSGLFGDVPLEAVRVGNIYYDRTGTEPTPHVQIEPFSHEVIFQATEWLENVVYAFLNEEEAQKEPPRDMCEKVCGFFTKCRGYDTDVEGLITNEDHLIAIDLALQARELASQAKRLKNEATLRLKDVQGHTATHTLRWTEVNGGPVSYYRETGMRMSLTKKKK